MRHQRRIPARKTHTHAMLPRVSGYQRRMYDMRRRMTSDRGGGIQNGAPLPMRRSAERIARIAELAKRADRYCD